MVKAAKAPLCARTSPGRRMPAANSNASTPAPPPVLSGVYEDEFVREDGAWKILRRIDHTIMPTPEQWRQQMEAMRAARE